jgi:hypothetical protein
VVGSRSKRRRNTTEPLTIHRERVDDIPILLAQLDRIGVQPFLDEPSATHGNGVGLSLGWVTVLWLTHIPSEANHRLNHVKPWAKQRLHTLRSSPGQGVHPPDLSDDQLATAICVGWPRPSCHLRCWRAMWSHWSRDTSRWPASRV